jgi:squalene-hopene/tetraprenyl-beta-curcumene cyclase
MDIPPHISTARLDKLVEECIAKTQSYFEETQNQEGYWWGELESNPTMEAEYIMLTRFLNSDEGDRISLIANDIRQRQGLDGSWGMYYHAPGDLSTSIECYFALKLAGDLVDETHMVAAKEFILSKGGVACSRIFTKIWLALFKQWDWKGTPVMPPEMFLLPRWAPFNIYNWSSWARATIVPMLVILSSRPSVDLPREMDIKELYVESPDKTNHGLLLRNKAWLSYEKTFLLVDKFLRLFQRAPINPFRSMAIKRIEQWILDHQESDGSWGGIQPPWVYSLLALYSLGYTLDHPVVAKGLAGLRSHWSLLSDDSQSMRVQACLSPSWDTSLALIGLLDSGFPNNSPIIQKAVRWILRKEIRTRGDWAVKSPHLKPGGWSFEFDNQIYPDIDDISTVVMALNMARLDDAAKDKQRKEAVNRAVEWVIGMQSSNGGWAAFDKNNTSRIISKLPFSDFGELVDPPSVDVTAHLLEMFGRIGWTDNQPEIMKAINYVKLQQEKDGPWFGRWGVNYIYGTGSVLPALRAIGFDMSDPLVKKATEWLIAHQNPDGGWGETCASYVNRSLRGVGTSTASQTSWAIIALLAAGLHNELSVQDGLSYLVSNQNVNGTWDEPEFTGCGFPGYGTGDQPSNYSEKQPIDWQGEELGAGFMINYHLYRNYFPLWAMGRYQVTKKIEALSSF